jgi:glycosyltransferase A (GT-A) superfamily protein (DUF2064 family)
MNRKHLVAMVEYPDSENVSSRLAGEYSISRAVQLERIIRAQVLRQVLPVNSEFRATILYSPEEKSSSIESWLRWTRKRGRFDSRSLMDPLQAIAHASTYALDQGGGRVIVTGTKCLEPDREMVSRVFDALEETDMIIGPTSCGSLYLFGFRVLPDSLFENIPYGTADCTPALFEKLQSLDLDFEVLPEAVEIQSPEALAQVPVEQWQRLPSATRQEMSLLGFGELVKT